MKQRWIAAPFLGGLIGSLPCAGAAGAQESPAEGDVAAAPRPSLVLITIDTLRADHLGCYGYRRPTSPTIDAVAGESLLFERCYAVVPHTTPSHCSILTGVYPYEHGITSCSFRAAESVQESRAFTPTPMLQSYAQVLEKHGWSTGGFVSAAVVTRITGLASGFQAWTEPEGELRLGEETVADALAWIAAVEPPFFLWVHLFDVHAPPRQQQNRKYQKELAADEIVREHMKERGIPAAVKLARGRGGGGGGAVTIAPHIAEYDASIRLVDDQVAQILDALRARELLDRSTLVLTSDHGEGLGQHDFVSHGPTWGEQVRVPLLIRVPGRAAARIGSVVSSIDILPTAVALTPGLPAEELAAQARGRDALDESFDERPVFSMSPPMYGEHALTSGRWKLIEREDGFSLYDLESDPHERTDVAAGHADVVAGLRRNLAELIKNQKARRRIFKQGASEQALSAEEEAELRAKLEKLGYADGGEDPDEPDDGGGDGTRGGTGDGRGR